MKALDIDAFKKALKSHDLKATPQRLAVHRAMMELGHASAEMVGEHITGTSDTAISTASIYNILSQLASEGIYGRRLSSNNKMYFDINARKHLHLYDCRNHEFKDVQDEELVELVEKHFKGRRFRGYKLQDVEIQLICRPTRKKITGAL